MALILEDYQGQIVYLVLLLPLAAAVVVITQKIHQSEMVKMVALVVAAAHQDHSHLLAVLAIHHQLRHHKETVAALMED